MKALMKAFLNARKKRVFDISLDGKVIVIKDKDCITRITAKPDLRLEAVNVIENKTI